MHSVTLMMEINVSQNNILRIFFFIIIFTRNITITPALKYNTSCGIDKSPMTMIYEGYSKIEYYPWMGYLYYPLSQDSRITSAVVLITKEIVIASANEIDKFPKANFRKLVKVILGGNCSTRPIDIKEYAYYPSFQRNSSISEIALIQLDIESDKRPLRPICPPPTYYQNPEFYAFSYTEDCLSSRIKIHKMNILDLNNCQTYYRRRGIDDQIAWPKYTACATAKSGVPCMWRSGTVLAMRQSGRWLLLGFGIHGPGCSEPARFVDYSMYHTWVKSSILRIGQPAITRIGDSVVVLRRTMSRIQRFGVCDSEEMEREIYSDQVKVFATLNLKLEKVIYNLTLIDSIEYSCIIFRVQDAYSIHGINHTEPMLRLRRWCGGPRAVCQDFQHLSIDFFVEIFTDTNALFSINVYGKQAAIIDPASAIKISNLWARVYPSLAFNIYQIDFSKNATGEWFRVPAKRTKLVLSRKSHRNGQNGTSIKNVDLATKISTTPHNKKNLKKPSRTTPMSQIRIITYDKNNIDVLKSTTAEISTISNNKKKMKKPEVNSE